MTQKIDFDGSTSQNNPKQRKDLLPLWIKFFIWIFLFAGIIGCLILSFGAFLDDTDLSLYGIKTNHPYSATGIFICLLFISKGLVAFGLWFEYQWAPKAAIIDAILGIIICVMVMIVLPFVFTTGYKLTFRLELIPLYFYLTDMIKIDKKWVNLK